MIGLEQATAKNKYSFFRAHTNPWSYVFDSTFQVLLAIVKEHNISSVEELLRKPGETLILF